MEFRKIDFNGFEVRVKEINGDLWFVANDLEQITGHTNISDSISKMLDDDEVDKADIIDTIGRTQKQNIINESGFYTLMLRSNKPEARIFAKYVTNVILPQIRKTGTFGNNQLQANVTALQLGEQKVENLSKQIALLNKERRYEKMNNDKIKILMYSKPTIQPTQTDLFSNDNKFLE